MEATSRACKSSAALRASAINLNSQHARICQRSFSCVIPSICGRILCNEEVGSKLGLDKWRASAAFPIDLMMLQDDQDLKSRDKAIVALARTHEVEIGNNSNEGDGAAEVTVVGNTQSSSSSSSSSRPSSRARPVPLSLTARQGTNMATTTLASGSRKVPLVFCLAALSLDRHNRRFWHEQARRLVDCVAQETLSGSALEMKQNLHADSTGSDRKRGLLLMAHHDYQDDPRGREDGTEEASHEASTKAQQDGSESNNSGVSSSTVVDPDRSALEVGGHRLLTTVWSCVIRRPLLSILASEMRSLLSFRRLGGSSSTHATTREEVTGSSAACSVVEVTGMLPFRQLVCAPSRPSASSSGSQEKGQQDNPAKTGRRTLNRIHRLLEETGSWSGRLLLDARDPLMRTLQATPGVTMRPENIAITGRPYGLSKEEQGEILARPLTLPKEILRFDTRKIVQIS
ncbi:unnamed protein product [Amoebophrya sp. A25]|nr:unnamed protein product [Amoebophrya sp. A25]|eukprot:GSA25T00015569001.1